MSVILKFILPSFLIGAIAGAAGWYLFSPLFIDNIVAEELAVAETQLTGTFVNADNAHQGSGTVMVVTRADGVTEAQFTDFEVTNGPDLKVSLSAHPNPTSSDDVKGADWVSLGALKGNIGNQAYTIPADVDLSTYPSIVIWCEQFGVLFSRAVLSPES